MTTRCHQPFVCPLYKYRQAESPIHLSNATRMTDLIDAHPGYHYSPRSGVYSLGPISTAR